MSFTLPDPDEENSPPPGNHEVWLWIALYAAVIAAWALWMVLA